MPVLDAYRLLFWADMAFIYIVLGLAFSGFIGLTAMICFVAALVALAVIIIGLMAHENHVENKARERRIRRSLDEF